MCGIAGIFAYRDEAAPISSAELRAIREHMKERGPDGAGEWVSVDQRIGFGHRRLAIVDLTSAGAQPMASHDGRFIIVFNGEIYNYRELRSELVRSGAIIRSQSDTEVLLELYRRYGEAMCSRLRGMYAFAIWDVVDQRLYLARDPFGIKPLYVHDDGRTLRFASQVKALLAGGAIPPVIDPSAEAAYWVWGHVPEPATLYSNIVSLEAGNWLTLGRTGVRTTGTFESVAHLLRGLSEHQEVPNLRAVLLDSVRHHLAADVPVGLFLSSGIDSSVLAALATDVGSNLQTVTLGFEEFRGTPDDETVLAEETARQYGTRHQTIWVQKHEFDEQFSAFMHHMDQPTTDGLNTWFVARAAAQAGLKVAISGLGGDEFFGGYRSFRQIPQIRSAVRAFGLTPQSGRHMRRVMSPMMKLVAGRVVNAPKLASLFEYGSSWENAYLLRRALRMPWELRGAPVKAPVLSPDVFGLSPHAIIAYLESTHYMRGQLLRDADWAGMAHSVEIRVPLVDIEVVRAVGVKARTGTPWSKQDLMATATGLPRSLTGRAKTGFSVPLRAWGVADHGRDGRGLRFWQARVLSEQTASLGMTPRLDPTRGFVLWSPEMATHGGVQSYMWRLWEMLQAIDQPIASYGVSLQDKTVALQAFPHPLPVTRRATGASRSKIFFVLNALVGNKSSDVVVGHIHLAPVALVAKWLHRIERYYVVLHGIEAWRRRPWLERMALQGAACVVATTQYTATMCAALNNLPTSAIRVIPLCAEPNPVDPDPAYRLDGEWPILFVGRLSREDRYKGLSTVIRAMAALPRSVTGIKLHVVGDGDDLKYYADYAKANALDSDSITFHGRIGASKLEASYRDAKAFVMPSAKEGFGIVFIEAMRQGTPCIGSTSAGIPEVVRAGVEGELIEFDDAEELVRALMRLRRHPEYAEMLAVNAHRRFVEEYQFERFSTRWHCMLSGDISNKRERAVS